MRRLLNKKPINIYDGFKLTYNNDLQYFQSPYTWDQLVNIVNNTMAFEHNGGEIGYVFYQDQFFIEIYSLTMSTDEDDNLIPYVIWACELYKQDDNTVKITIKE